MQPIAPRRTILAKARGTPLMIAVPQSGPITSSSRSRAKCFNAISSSSETLSLNNITLSPSRSAFIASAAAYSPGVEINAKLAAGAAESAISMLLGGMAPALSPSAWLRGTSLSAFSADSIAAPSSASLRPRNTISRSLGPAAISPSIKRASRSKLTLAGVAMTTEACSTPDILPRVAESCMSDTESRYRLRTTRVAWLICDPSFAGAACARGAVPSSTPKVYCRLDRYDKTYPFAGGSDHAQSRPASACPRLPYWCPHGARGRRRDCRPHRAPRRRQGITLVAPAFQDEALCALGGAIHRALVDRAGATGLSLPQSRPKAAKPNATVRLAVCGAH